MVLTREKTLKLWNEAKSFDDLLILQERFLRGEIMGTPDWGRLLFEDTRPFIPFLIAMLREFHIFSVGGQGLLWTKTRQLHNEKYTTTNIPREFHNLPTFYCQVRQRQHLELLIPKKLLSYVFPLINKSKNFVISYDRKILSQTKMHTISVTQVKCDVEKKNVVTRRWRNTRRLTFSHDYSYFEPAAEYPLGRKLYPWIIKNYDIIDIVDLDWTSKFNLAQMILEQLQSLKK